MGKKLWLENGQVVVVRDRVEIEKSSWLFVQDAENQNDTFYVNMQNMKIFQER
jgi:hypothetical protein